MVKITALYDPEDDEIDDDSPTGLTEDARARIVDELTDQMDLYDITVEPV